MTPINRSPWCVVTAKTGRQQIMMICEFCLLHSPDGTCRLGLTIPKTMKCREFAPGIEKFCAKPTDFVSVYQIVEMAKFFGLEKTELKKVRIIAERRAVYESGENVLTANDVL